MAQGILRENIQIRLDASGNGTAKLGPASAREVWYPDKAHVSANQQPANEAQCAIYVGESPIQQYFRDRTFTGSSGDASGKVTGPVQVDSFIWAVWTGGDPLAYAVLLVTGVKEI